MSILIVDTNVWAYYFDGDSPEHESVGGTVRRGFEIGADCNQHDSSVRFPLVISDFEYKSSLDSIEMLKRYSHLGVGGRDSTILALMRRLKIKKIMTHDESLKKVDWLDASDPVSAG